MHLLMDGYSDDVAALSKPSLVRRLLKSLPKKLGMTEISRAKVIDYKAKNPKDSGVTGNIMLAESHITIHTFPNRGYVAIDVFSCKPFRTRKVTAQLKKEFSMGKADVRVIGRKMGDW